MAESTLSETRADIIVAIARYLDLGYTAEASLSGDDLTEVLTALKDGYRNFLLPDALPEDVARGKQPHTWSFLKPVLSLATVVGDDEYDLPDNVAWVIGDKITFGDTTSYPALEMRSEAWIRLQQQQHVGNSRPMYFATRYKADAGTGQRMEILLYPTPDAIYTLSYRAMLNVDALTASQYPPGGMQHSATVKAFCLAAAEFNRNSQHGPMWDDALRLLRKSVALDRTIAMPDNFGRMSADGDEGSARFRSPDLDVTYEGVSYLVQTP